MAEIDQSLPSNALQADDLRWISEDNSKHLAVNLAAAPQEALTQGNIADSSNLEETVSETIHSIKTSYIKELFKKGWRLIAAESKSEGSQLAEEQKDLSAQCIGARPSLARPEKNMHAGMEDLLTLFKKEHDQKIIKIKDAEESLDTDPTKINFSGIGEAEIELSTYAVYKKEAKNRKTECINLKDAILQDAAEKKRLWSQYLDLKKEAERRAKFSKIFSWMTLGTGIIGGSLLVGGLVAAAVGTGGLAIPAVLAVASGLAAIVGGTSGISGSVFTYLGNKSNGEAFATKEKGNLKKDEIMVKLQNMEQNDNSATQLWSNVGRLLRNTPNNIFR